MALVIAAPEFVTATAAAILARTPLEPGLPSV
jgi:hypothetical protein